MEIVLVKLTGRVQVLAKEGVVYIRSQNRGFGVEDCLTEYLASGDADLTAAQK